MSTYPCKVQDVIIINRGWEDAEGQRLRIIGTDLYVGDDTLTLNNTPCNANPTSTGVWSCGGLQGKYLGIGKQSTTDFLSIGQIRAYSYVLNGH